MLLILSIAGDSIASAFAQQESRDGHLKLKLDNINSQFCIAWIIVNALFQLLTSYLVFQATYIGITFVNMLAKDLPFSRWQAHARILIVFILWSGYIVYSTLTIVAFSYAYWNN